jgi:S1-C subfamily serine protease
MAWRRAVLAGTALLAVSATFAGAARAGSVVDAFDRVHRSVVVVRTTERDAPASGDRRLIGVIGSGVRIDFRGKVLTAAHLVGAASEVRVEFVDGRQVSARVIASEPDADVALLQLDSVPSDAVAARLADSDLARIGDGVFIVGTPYGIGHTVTVGHLSGRHSPSRVWDRFQRAELLQNDAAINWGNSGGPMFSMDGEVLGVVSHLISRSGGFEGLGFVVSSNIALKLVFGRRPPWWGFEGVLLGGDLLKAFNLPGSVCSCSMWSMALRRRDSVFEAAS